MAACLAALPLIAAVAGTGGSVLANSAAQSERDEERRRVMAAEAARQSNYDRQIGDLNDGMVGRFDKFGKKQGRSVADLESLYSKESAEVPTGLSGAPAPTGDVITQQGEKSAAETSKGLDKQAENRAELRGVGDTLGQTGFANARDAGAIGTLAGFKQGSSAVLPHRLEAANQAGSGLQLIGDIFSGIGGLGMTAATAGGFPGLEGLFGTGLAPASTSVVPAPRPFMPTPPAAPPLPRPRPDMPGLMAGLY